MNVLCVGPGPHAPADGIMGEVPDGTPVPRALCAPCSEHMPPNDEASVPTEVAVLTLAAELADQRTRLDAAQAVLVDRMTPEQLDTATQAGWIVSVQDLTLQGQP